MKFDPSDGPATADSVDAWLRGRAPEGDRPASKVKPRKPRGCSMTLEESIPYIRKVLGPWPEAYPDA